MPKSPDETGNNTGDGTKLVNIVSCDAELRDDEARKQLDMYSDSKGD
jgi:hypothetical protein